MATQNDKAELPPVGTFFLTGVDQVDEGELGERRAPAGSVGVVVEHRGDQCQVEFQPAGVWGFWSADDFARNGEILDANDPVIPSPEKRNASSAVHFLLMEASIADNGIAGIEPEQVEDLRHAFSGINQSGLLSRVLPEGATSLSGEAFNELAEAAGLADRFDITPQETMSMGGPR